MNANTLLVIDISFLITLLFLLSRTVYLRFNRVVLLQKYKNDEARYKIAEGMTSVKRLVIVIVLTMVVTAKLVYDLRRLEIVNGSSLVQQIMPLLGFSVALFVVVALVIYCVFKKNNLIIKP